MKKPYKPESINLDPMNLPGIFQLENQVYHALEGISKSGWSKFSLSPLGYIFEKKHPTPPKTTWDVGTVAHAILLEGKTLQDVIIRQPADIKVRRGKKWDAFEAEHSGSGKVIMKDADWLKVNGIVQAGRAHPRHDELLTGGVAEQSFFWLNEEYGFIQKCRPDYLPGLGVVTSLKTTGNAHPWPFGKIAGDLKYHWSAYLEMHGVTVCTGEPHTEYNIMVIEQEPPHQCVVYQHYGADIDAGRQQLEILYPKYAECLENDVWPGYEDGMLHLPAYTTYVDYDQVDDDFINPKMFND